VCLSESSRVPSARGGQRRVGLSANETAEALGISAGNVRITQYRALTKLRGMVQHDLL
jgi:DNA-directed RNA polymerase specialized sigma24 family protein